MSNDLISRSAALKALEYVFDKYRMSWDKERYGGFGREVPEAIRNLPVAYDVDKVVEQIKDKGKAVCCSVKCNDNCNDCEHGCLMNRILKSVKAGGVSDNY